jgi:hypothetical protein
MGWENEQTAIRAKFDGWTATRIRWPGTPFSEPASAYIAVHVLNGEGQELTIGMPAQRRHVGVVSVQVFDKENNGQTTIAQLADQIEARFINANSQDVLSGTETISFEQPSLSPEQVIQGWRQKNVTIPFYRDEFK